MPLRPPRSPPRRSQLSPDSEDKCELTGCEVARPTDFGVSPLILGESVRTEKMSSLQAISQDTCGNQNRCYAAARIEQSGGLIHGDRGVWGLDRIASTSALIG